MSWLATSRRPGGVLVAYRDRELRPVEWDTLEKARGSQYKPFPPRHTWYTFDFATARPPAQAEVVQSIGEACRGMLAPPIANLGVKGSQGDPGDGEAAADPRRGRAAPHLRNVAMFIDRRGGTGEASSGIGTAASSVRPRRSPANPALPQWALS